ncbi:AAA family ATPase [Ruminococcaceae bacterium OttesenSCG-928-D13]|nr:AAA family ATPase [Ruminococcaceae bacterium OttesenSCG-928-D13]
MGRIFAVSNQKGGVGKTTTTSALAAALQKRGKSVLCVDMDPQGNLSFSMGAENEGVNTTYEVLKGECTAKAAVQASAVCPIIPGNILLSGSELEFTGQGREFLLCNALRPLRESYDFILLDTPPALSILTVNAFTAADRLIIPMLSDIFSLQGITQLYETVTHVKTYCNPNLQFAGILLTRFMPRTTLANEVRGTAEMISSELEIPLFRTCIRNSVSVSEAQALQRNIMEYSPRNIAIKDYLALADELLRQEEPSIQPA